MNLLTTNQQLTMSNREIAELTGKRHDNVRRMIESLLDCELISVTQSE
jgi:phage regulator Rha-like protein